MNCNKCGYQIKEGDLFCSNCGNKIENVDINNYQSNNNQMNNYQSSNNQINNNEDNTKANNLCILSLVLSFGATIPLVLLSLMIPFFKSLLSNLAGLCPLAGFILMIYVRVKYPNNTFGKVVMWIHIVLVMLYIISIIIVMIACYAACTSANLSGCG